MFGDALRDGVPVRRPVCYLAREFEVNKNRGTPENASSASQLLYARIPPPPQKNIHITRLTGRRGFLKNTYCCIDLHKAGISHSLTRPCHSLQFHIVISSSLSLFHSPSLSPSPSFILSVSCSLILSVSLCLRLSVSVSCSLSHSLTLSFSLLLSFSHYLASICFLCCRL